MKRTPMILGALTLAAVSGAFLLSAADSPRQSPFSHNAPQRPAPKIPGGTLLQVRINESVSTARNRPGDHFSAVLTAPVVVNGATLAPSGTLLRGTVRGVLPVVGRFHRSRCSHRSRRGCSGGFHHRSGHREEERLHPHRDPPDLPPCPISDPGLIRTLNPKKQKGAALCDALAPF